jgi:cellulose synthase/poly-beta-1,6-N-acetylglucosamine synthase-like glycosyltransferase
VALALWKIALLCLAAVSVPLHGYGVYVLLLLLAASVRPRPARSPLPGEPPRIAVLIVAHDEERVVHASVASLVAQRYPADRHAVFVVADNCTDRTAEVARAHGARVLERRTGSAEGKSRAVAFGIDAIRAAGGFDVVTVFDADNAADPDFLEVIAARLATGERVVQGFVDSKNPDASWVAGSSALGFWAIAELAQAPRERLRLSTPLMGTGFALRLDDALDLLGTGGGLTDDLDLGARLALRGIRVAYEPSARTVDEKPTELSTAVAQRHRWMRGRWVVVGGSVPALLRLGFSPGAASFATRVRAVDVAVQLVAPSLLFTAVATGLVSLAVAVVFWVSGLSLGPFLPGSLAATATYYLVPALGIARHRPGMAVWLCYLVQPLYLALSLPLAVSGFATRHGARWVRTPKG